MWSGTAIFRCLALGRSAGKCSGLIAEARFAMDSPLEEPDSNLWSHL